MLAKWLQNLFTVAIATATLLTALTEATAGEPKSPPGRYFPLSQNAAPGVAARMLNRRRGNEYYIQPVRIVLPRSGSVGVFVPGTGQYGSAMLKQMNVMADQSHQAGLAVGHTYRMRIADLPNYPRLELFPSLEMLDRLHPPAELKHDFPIPINITQDELEAAAAGKLVTKAIFLEQPQLVIPGPDDQTMEARTVTLAPNMNILAEADKRGRPLAILRIGSRKPVVNANNYGFFGVGGPVEDSFPTRRHRNDPPRLRFISGQRASRN